MNDGIAWTCFQNLTLKSGTLLLLLTRTLIHRCEIPTTNWGYCKVYMSVMSVYWRMVWCSYVAN